MAPARPREPSIERTSEYEEFMNKLEEYHAKRGTTLEREPKVGQRHLDLLRLYKRVCEEGGYDRVSDTKGNKLAWRRIAAEFLPPSSNATTQAFVVKNAYYKNLAAYEITNVHHKEPPPKEILEDVTAKGGDLLNRTIDNYHGSASRDIDGTNGQDSEGSDEEMQKTPKEDKMDVDEPGSTGGRVTRALRHAPPQRVLFQPEASSGRQTRSGGQHNSPTPGTANAYGQTNGSYAVNGNSMSIIANYEPKPVVPSNVKPVTTPSNNPDHFRNLRAKLSSRSSRTQSMYNKGMMLPGTGFTGPNIYIRALLSLQSPNVEEQAYALHHLVKISHERGDKYRFDGFPGLAEALITRLLEVSKLFYGVQWEISYNEEEASQRDDALNALSGTPDLLRKIGLLKPMDLADGVHPREFCEALGRVNEAGLVIRNLVMLDANAEYVSRLPLIQDFITIALNLPNRSSVIELKHYAMEIAEQMTRYWTLTSDHHVYRSLVAQLETDDRSAMITSMRAMSRIAMNVPGSRYQLENIPVPVIQRVCDWLLVEDEQLREAVLDFLYLYTISVENVETLTQNVDVPALAKQLTRLLLHNAQTVRAASQPKSLARPSGPIPETAPKLAFSVIEQLVMLDEPERSSQWLKTCFEEDQAGEITQIALWTAYNSAFNSAISTLTAQHLEKQASSLPSTPGSTIGASNSKPPKPMMQAKDFITNVSSTFPSASAQVITQGGTQKYTIKGIRPRHNPVDFRNRPYIKCRWQTQPSIVVYGDDGECGEYAKEPRQIWEHILSAHLGLSKDATGKWQVEDSAINGIKAETNGGMDGLVSNNSTTTPKTYECRWGGCRHFNGSVIPPTAFQVGMHIQTHLPDNSDKAALRSQHNHAPEPTPPPPSLAQPPFYMGGIGGMNDGLTANAASFRRNHHDPWGRPQPPPASIHPPNPNPADIKWLNTALDDRASYQNVSGAASLVLRHLAQRLAQLSKPSKPTSKGKVETENWVEKAFGPIKEELWYVVAHNQSLKEGVCDLMGDIEEGGA
ncbi:hypothetical protein K490DRAFT_32897 [Saccharata proteae CBS 121410]|uniref:ARID domain-containing protein n=1 Tax=Saccharata proteae CBS 121410 TaxID=1314787 RepID=A0A9P4HY28_9PEZI|nr:hypothetical protein K490DRAFT_32897 [Saccharata proteae CBS 121410]